MKDDEPSQSEARSGPLKSTYNSTSITLVLVIAAILGAILMLWPSGGF